MLATAPDFAGLLRDAGLRLTAPRIAVLAALHAGPAHVDAAAITEAARGRIGVISTQAVYDVLDRLMDAGMVRRIEPAGGPARFELRVGDNHHHIVCRSCAAVADVACVVGAAPCLTPSSTSGFSIDEAEVTFWGLCASCSGSGDSAERKGDAP